MSSVTFVCLANSSRHRKHCVAGIDIKTKKWVRLVNKQDEPLSTEDIAYEDKNEPKVLDVIKAQILRPEPVNHHVENIINNGEYYWKKVSTFYVDELDQFCDNEKLIFLDTDDCILKSQIRQLSFPHSLKLVKPCRVNIYKTDDNWGKPRIRVNFLYNDKWYDFVLTDLYWKSFFIKNLEYKAYDFNRIGSFYLTISLGEEYNDKHYKLVAGLIPDRTMSQFLLGHTSFLKYVVKHAE